MPYRHVTERAARAKCVAEPWGTMAWLVDANRTPGASMSLARMEVAPGFASPLHRHANCDEAVALVAGCVTALVDGREIVMRPGDLCWVGSGSLHGVRNDGPVTAVLLITFSTGAREYEAA